MIKNKHKRFVIGDIHGCFDTMEQLLFDILKITKNDDVYFIGEYIDRGPKSNQVLDLLMDLKESNYKIFPIIGNHEEMMLLFGKSSENLHTWYRNGGKQIWKSLNVDFPTKIDRKYFDFIKSMQYYYELDNFIIVHAGLNFQNKNIFQDQYSMLWSRDNQYNAAKAKGKKLITGHTPVTLDRVKLSLSENIVFIDGGCAYSKEKGFGKLVALELNTMELFWTDCIDEID